MTKTKIAQKNNLLSILKTSTGQKQIKFPEDLDFNLVSNSLTIEISTKAIFSNMQTDASAFEAWALVLKTNISNINDVYFKWEEPQLHFTSPNNRQHYQRFLYRMEKFTSCYSWSKIENSNADSFSQYVIPSDGKNIVNTPSKKRPRNSKIPKPLSQYSYPSYEPRLLG
jgi:hypothetical protein